MCIVLLSTCHPTYALVLVNNRDEYLLRPTSPAAFWPPPHAHILGGRDLLREEHGTWLGVTTAGQIAVLTNFREDDNFIGGRSRGAMVNAFLKTPVAASDNGEDATQRFVKRLLLPSKGEDSPKGVGGFSLLCGVLRPYPATTTTSPATPAQAIAPLAILSNRTPRPDAASWICGARGQTHGLSNTHFNTALPKVTRGKALLAAAIEANVAGDGSDKEKLIARLLADVLSDNTMPARKTGQSKDTYLGETKCSIFVPVLFADEDHHDDNGDGDDGGTCAVDPNARLLASTTLTSTQGLSGRYATQKQTVVLVDWAGKVTYLERTLWDERAEPVGVGQGDRRFEYVIEGWEG
ncbi:MAG: hypothetical protein M1839_007580 [Geoglossum umbratile]|nr:MAG: hypothetical protein M1839_007580 [Geoglossum umbratile]